jgi:two-component system OmpR family response regulator
MSAPAHGDRRLEGAAILVVDDDQDILAGIALALQMEGAEVIAASNGVEALARAVSEEPDLVVLDLMLPAVSGLSVAERLRNIAPDLPVVMVTANKGLRHKEFALRMGISAYFTKPVPLAHLIDTVVSLIPADDGGE